MIASLPMYDWPEARAEVDAQWVALRDAMRVAGIDAPARLLRRNGDLPAIANDAAAERERAKLPSEELDFQAMWRHPALLFAQTCWGPLELGLASHVQVVSQPSYDAYEGGRGGDYSSAILMRRGEGAGPVAAPTDGRPVIPLSLIRSKRFAYNSTDSMSGTIAITRDLEALGESLAIFSGLLESGGHRNSIVALTEGRADVCAADCRSWALAQRFEPAAGAVEVVGWTARRKGLPYITALDTNGETLARLRAAVASVDQPALSLASNG